MPMEYSHDIRRQFAYITDYSHITDYLHYSHNISRWSLLSIICIIRIILACITNYSHSHHLQTIRIYY